MSPPPADVSHVRRCEQAYGAVKMLEDQVTELVKQVAELQATLADAKVTGLDDV